MRSYRTNRGERRFVAGLIVVTTAVISVAIIVVPGVRTVIA